MPIPREGLTWRVLTRNPDTVPPSHLPPIKGARAPVRTYDMRWARSQLYFFFCAELKNKITKGRGKRVNKGQHVPVTAAQQTNAIRPETAPLAVGLWSGVA